MALPRWRGNFSQTGRFDQRPGRLWALSSRIFQEPFIKEYVDIGADTDIDIDADIDI